MKVAIIRFLGTNCEFDTAYAFAKIGIKADIVWHEEAEFKADLVVLPGGFSYGDYLRSGAIAKFAKAMRGVLAHAQKGGFVLGICNGFQMLLELGLLKGAMKHNENLSFISKNQPHISPSNFLSCCLLFIVFMDCTNGVLKCSPLCNTFSSICPNVVLTPVYPVGITLNDIDTTAIANAITHLISEISFCLFFTTVTVKKWRVLGCRGKKQKSVMASYHVTLIPIDMLAFELRGIHSLLVLPRMWSMPMKKL